LTVIQADSSDWQGSLSGRRALIAIVPNCTVYVDRGPKYREKQFGSGRTRFDMLAAGSQPTPKLPSSSDCLVSFRAGEETHASFSAFVLFPARVVRRCFCPHQTPERSRSVIPWPRGPMSLLPFALSTSVRVTRSGSDASRHPRRVAPDQEAAIHVSGDPAAVARGR
jgi:hypothetical protein